MAVKTVTFKPGESGNPNGKPNGSVKRYQSFVERASYLAGNHTVGELRQIIADQKKFDALPYNDGAIIKRMVESLGDDGNASMNSLLDRIIGKPVQPIAQKVEHSVGADTLAAMKEIAQLTREDKLTIKQILDSRIIEQVPVREE